MSSGVRKAMCAKLLAEVEAYLAATEMAASRFSTLATGDPSFVTGLRSAWPSVGPKRAARARRWMAEHPEGAA